jgi:hypothetical protein
VVSSLGMSIYSLPKGILDSVQSPSLVSLVILSGPPASVLVICTQSFGQNPPLVPSS